VKELNMPKNMFGCPLKFILGFLGFLALKIKYSYTIICDCEKSPLTHDYLLFNFSSFFT
jgi:hypothetical protein